MCRWPLEMTARNGFWLPRLSDFYFSRIIGENAFASPALPCDVDRAVQLDEIVAGAVVPGRGESQ
jgi:hypothetical protein